jgi:hypothetical protein
MTDTKFWRQQWVNQQGGMIRLLCSFMTLTWHCMLKVQTSRCKIWFVRRHWSCQIDDNGYLNRSTTVPPLETSFNCSDFRFSKWLESIYNWQKLQEDVSNPAAANHKISLLSKELSSFSFGRRVSIVFKLPSEGSPPGQKIFQSVDLWLLTREP